MPSHLAAAAAYTGALSAGSRCRSWQSRGARAASPATRAHHAPEMWAGTPWGVLHFKLLRLKLRRVLDAYQIFTAVWSVSHFFWRHFKVVSAASDLLTLSRSGRDHFCFHCRSERARECQGSLPHLINPSLSPLKCVCRLFL